MCATLNRERGNAMTRTIQRTSTTVVTLALCALLAQGQPTPALAQEDPVGAPVPEARTRFDNAEFPDLLGSLAYERKRVHEDPAFGVTAMYRGGRRRATISVYDRGLTDIPDDIAAPVVRDAFAQSCRDLESGVADGVYRKVSLRDSSETVVHLPWREARFLRATYEVEVAETPTEPALLCTLHIFLTVQDGFFVRERYAHPVDVADDTEARRALEDLAGLLALRYLDDAWTSEEDFRRAEPVVHRMALWLVGDPRYPPDTLRVTTAAYVLKWIMRAPYLRGPVDTGFLALALKDGNCECDDFVTTMYTIGCGLHLMDSPESGATTARIAGMEFMLDAHAKLVAGGGELTDCAALAPLVGARAAGTLAAMLEE